MFNSVSSEMLNERNRGKELLQEIFFFRIKKVDDEVVVSSIFRSSETDEFSENNVNRNYEEVLAKNFL